MIKKIISTFSKVDYKAHLKYIVPTCLVVYIIAAVQVLVVLDLELHPRTFIVPTFVGIIFGSLMAQIRILTFRLHESSIIDNLTGLHNRKWFAEPITEYLENFRRYGTQLSIVMIDIDNFKAINDTYGHSVGDDVLAKVGSIIKETSRTTDCCIRWGGEEFLVMLPATGLETAHVKAEKLRKKIASENFPAVGEVTGSFGVTEVNSPEITQEKLLKRADDALYKAKNKGKNCVQVCA